MIRGLGRLARRRLAESPEALIVENDAGRPVSIPEGEKDWELDISGYSQLLGRPVASGWRLRNLQDEAADLERVEYEVTYVGTAATLRRCFSGSWGTSRSRLRLLGILY
ncbi:MAG TPA: hypothetical protein VMV09_05850 [Candidatus Saccharimonadales bacterium]|nr:hypothetical protein [Candidatus Saccharimonadales bacterium]